MISGKMVKRRNIKRRDNEVEGDDSRSDVTLSAVEKENDSGDDSDVGLREGANTLKDNTSVVPPVIVSEQEGTFTDHVTDCNSLLPKVPFLPFSLVPRGLVFYLDSIRYIFSPFSLVSGGRLPNS